MRKTKEMLRTPASRTIGIIHDHVGFTVGQGILRRTIVFPQKNTDLGLVNQRFPGPSSNVQTSHLTPCNCHIIRSSCFRLPLEPWHRKPQILLNSRIFFVWFNVLRFGQHHNVHVVHVTRSPNYSSPSDTHIKLLSWPFNVLQYDSFSTGII